MNPSLFISHLSLLNHGLAEHPENSKRLESILNQIESSHLSKFLTLNKERLATKDELSQIHTPAYIEKVFSLDGKREDLDPETPLTPGSVYAARLATGLCFELLESVLSKKVANGFALVRPPGHHARPDQGMGFCVFNSIALTAKKALSQGLDRILILDWDVHHGNGTQEAFYEDDRVLLIDLHQENLFPKDSGTRMEKGKDKGLGFTVNVPLPHSCEDRDYLFVIDEIVKPLVSKFKPELILVSAGFDAHISDPLASMSLTSKAYKKMTEKVKTLAQEHCEGKLILVLEGGYDPHYLAENVLACAQVLAEPMQASYMKSSEEPREEVVQLIEQIKNDLR